MNVYLHVATDKLYVIGFRGWKNDAKSFELGYIKRLTEFSLKQKIILVSQQSSYDFENVCTDQIIFSNVRVKDNKHSYVIVTPQIYWFMLLKWWFKRHTQKPLFIVSILSDTVVHIQNSLFLVFFLLQNKEKGIKFHKF